MGNARTIWYIGTSLRLRRLRFDVKRLKDTARLAADTHSDHRTSCTERKPLSNILHQRLSHSSRDW
jgi:hypothetical protein